MSNDKLIKIKTQEQIKQLEANIRWREMTDRFEGLDALEQKLKELKKSLESLEF